MNIATKSGSRAYCGKIRFTATSFSKAACGPALPRLLAYTSAIPPVAIRRSSSYGPRRMGAGMEDVVIDCRHLNMTRWLE